MRTLLAVPGALIPVALSFNAQPAAAQPLPAPPAGAAVQLGDLVRAEVRPGWITPQGTRMVALHLQLAAGWKTYWRIPGEAGIAPRFDWSASQNLAGVRVHWPQPVVFDQAGFRSIGYLGELVLPLELTPERAGRPIVLDGQVSIGVCNDICVPAELQVGGLLRGNGAHDAAIATALATVARPAREAGMSGALRCTIQPAARGLEVTLRATLPRQGTTEHMVVELPGARVWMGESRTWREGGDLVARAQMRAPRGEPLSLDRGRLQVTILGGPRMLEHAGCSAQ
jgi:DsbC/DsbD-like thiol-disulfide interchange protein